MAQSKNNGGKKLPSHIRYWVPEREGAPWIRLGVLWPHQDGKGFNEDSELMPAPGAVGHVVLRAFEPKDEGEGA